MNIDRDFAVASANDRIETSIDYAGWYKHTHTHAHQKYSAHDVGTHTHTHFMVEIIMLIQYDWFLMRRAQSIIIVVCVYVVGLGVHKLRMHACVRACMSCVFFIHRFSYIIHSLHSGELFMMCDTKHISGGSPLAGACPTSTSASCKINGRGAGDEQDDETCSTEFVVPSDVVCRVAVVAVVVVAMYAPMARVSTISPTV